jgi:3-oxoacyl-[acyl-carrier protein] reductase
LSLPRRNPIVSPAMKDKCVLVTGSGTGIGRETALEFARQGANVVFHYSGSAEGAESGAEEARKLGVKARAFKADFSDLEQVKKLGAEAEGFLGRIDALVNNAGITINKPFFKVEPAQFEKLYNVNVKAAYFLAQKLAAGMIQRGGGAICNLTSIHGFVGAAEHSVYAGKRLCRDEGRDYRLHTDPGGGTGAQGGAGECDRAGVDHGGQLFQGDPGV